MMVVARKATDDRTRASHIERGTLLVEPRKLLLGKALVMAASQAWSFFVLFPCVVIDNLGPDRWQVLLQNTQFSFASCVSGKFGGVLYHLGTENDDSMVLVACF